MKNFKILLIIIVICSISSCYIKEDGVEGYPSVNSVYSLCISNIDGSYFQESKVDYISKYLFIIQNDERILSLNNDRLQMIDLSNMNIIQDVKLNFYSIIHAEISPNKKYLVVSATTDVNMDLYLIDLTNYEISNLTHTPNQIENYPSFSHDSSEVVYTTSPTESGNGDQTISIYDIKSKQSKVILKRPDRKDMWTPFFNYPKFDDSDSNIYFINNNVNMGILDTLCIYSIKDSSNISLYGNLSYFGPLKISSNSERVAAITNDYPNHLISKNLKDLQASYIDELPQNDFEYSFSKGGTKLAYVVMKQKNKFENQTVNEFFDYELWVSNSDGTDKKLLSNGIEPIFSDDGSKVVFYKITYQIY